MLIMQTPALEIGCLLDLRWNHVIIHGVAIYSKQNFLFAMWMIPIGFIANIIIVRFVKETYCKFQC